MLHLSPREHPRASSSPRATHVRLRSGAGGTGRGEQCSCYLFSPFLDHTALPRPSPGAAACPDASAAGTQALRMKLCTVSKTVLRSCLFALRPFPFVPSRVGLGHIMCHHSKERWHAEPHAALVEEERHSVEEGVIFTLPLICHAIRSLRTPLNFLAPVAHGHSPSALCS